MPNGNGSFDPIASYARLSERVENQGRDIVDLRSNMNTGFRNLEGSIKSLADQLSAGSKTQWPVIWSAIGVLLAVILAVGSQALSPIREGLTDAKTDIRANAASSLSVASFIDFKNTYENNRIVSRTENLDKFSNVNGRVDKLSDQMVPRQELDRVFQGYDQRFSDMQRQVDEGRSALGGTYSLRDYIQRLTERQDRLEQQLRLANPPS